ncbi:MAG TPA: sulfatase [Erysipelotrichaceae bacterium]|nr:sulfatase [Erysipelotrichaceae bacterium]
MRAVMLMYDTLTRNYLPNYGCNFSVMPNFRRLAERSITFDEFYGGSMPCMPARRELHTGKYNFLHRGWGPLEPYDDSMPETLAGNGICTHLVTDHSHYWEDGGCTYHGRYSSWEGFRGQEGDRWVPRGEADLSLNTCSLNKKNISVVQHLANRTRIVEEEDMPSVQTVSAGIDFIDHYHDKDSWFLQIECFDPHEPFYVPEKYRKLYDCCKSEDAFNFPAYTAVDDKYTQEEICALRKEYCALLSLCDEQLGRVLDAFDQYDLWKDTMLIVNTDHGFFLGEHNFIGKNFPPMYDEVIHTPFFIHDPRYGHDGERRNSVCQTVDIVPTLMNYFGVEPFADMDGRDLAPVIEKDEKIHDQILYGLHGGQVNVYDGRYVFMKGSTSKDQPVYNLTLMPTNMRGFFAKEELKSAELVDGGRYSHHLPVLQVPALHSMGSFFSWPDALYDKANDPEQKTPVTDPELIRQMTARLKSAMKAADAPDWQYKRLGIDK